MTMIVNGYATKKALKEAVASNPREVRVQDPALMVGWQKYHADYFTLPVMQVADRICVTNHPKRSWFAEIVRVNHTTWKVL